MDIDLLVLAWKRWDAATSDRPRILELEARLLEASEEIGLPPSEIRERVNVIRSTGLHVSHAVAQMFREAKT